MSIFPQKMHQFLLIHTKNKKVVLTRYNIIVTYSVVVFYPYSYLFGSERDRGSECEHELCL